MRGFLSEEQLKVMFVKLMRFGGHKIEITNFVIFLPPLLSLYIFSLAPRSAKIIKTQKDKCRRAVSNMYPKTTRTAQTSAPEATVDEMRAYLVSKKGGEQYDRPATSGPIRSSSLNRFARAGGLTDEKAMSLSPISHVHAKQANGPISGSKGFSVRSTEHGQGKGTWGGLPSDATAYISNTSVVDALPAAQTARAQWEERVGRYRAAAGLLDKVSRQTGDDMPFAPWLAATLEALSAQLKVIEGPSILSPNAVPVHFQNKGNGGGAEVGKAPTEASRGSAHSGETDQRKGFAANDFDEQKGIGGSPSRLLLRGNRERGGAGGSDYHSPPASSSRILQAVSPTHKHSLGVFAAVSSKEDEGPDVVQRPHPLRSAVAVAVLQRLFVSFKLPTSLWRDVLALIFDSNCANDILSRDFSTSNSVSGYLERRFLCDSVKQLEAERLDLASLNKTAVAQLHRLHDFALGERKLADKSRLKIVFSAWRSLKYLSAWRKIAMKLRMDHGGSLWVRRCFDAWRNFVAIEQLHGEVMEEKRKARAVVASCQQAIEDGQNELRRQLLAERKEHEAQLEEIKSKKVMSEETTRELEQLRAMVATYRQDQRSNERRIKDLESIVREQAQNEQMSGETSRRCLHALRRTALLMVGTRIMDGIKASDVIVNARGIGTSSQFRFSSNDGVDTVTAASALPSPALSAGLMQSTMQTHARLSVIGGSAKGGGNGGSFVALYKSKKTNNKVASSASPSSPALGAAGEGTLPPPTASTTASSISSTSLGLGILPTGSYDRSSVGTSGLSSTATPPTLFPNADPAYTNPLEMSAVSNATTAIVSGVHLSSVLCSFVNGVIQKHREDLRKEEHQQHRLQLRMGIGGNSGNGNRGATSNHSSPPASLANTARGVSSSSSNASSSARRKAVLLFPGITNIPSAFSDGMYYITLIRIVFGPHCPLHKRLEQLMSRYEEGGASAAAGGPTDGVASGGGGGGAKGEFTISPSFARSSIFRAEDSNSSSRRSTLAAAHQDAYASSSSGFVTEQIFEAILLHFDDAVRHYAQQTAKVRQKEVVRELLASRRQSAAGAQIDGIGVGVGGGFGSRGPVRRSTLGPSGQGAQSTCSSPFLSSSFFHTGRQTADDQLLTEEEEALMYANEAAFGDVGSDVPLPGEGGFASSYSTSLTTAHLSVDLINDTLQGHNNYSTSSVENGGGGASANPLVRLGDLHARLLETPFVVQDFTNAERPLHVAAHYYLVACLLKVYANTKIIAIPQWRSELFNLETPSHAVPIDLSSSSPFPAHIRKELITAAADASSEGRNRGSFATVGNASTTDDESKKENNGDDDDEEPSSLLEDEKETRTIADATTAADALSACVVLAQSSINAWSVLVQYVQESYFFAFKSVFVLAGVPIVRFTTVKGTTAKYLEEGGDGDGSNSVVGEDDEDDDQYDDGREGDVNKRGKGKGEGFRKRGSSAEQQKMSRPRRSSYNNNVASTTATTTNNKSSMAVEFVETSSDDDDDTAEEDDENSDGRSETDNDDNSNTKGTNEEKKKREKGRRKLRLRAKTLTVVSGGGVLRSSSLVSPTISSQSVNTNEASEEHEQRRKESKASSRPNSSSIRGRKGGRRPTISIAELPSDDTAVPVPELEQEQGAADKKAAKQRGSAEALVRRRCSSITSFSANTQRQQQRKKSYPSSRFREAGADATYLYPASYNGVSKGDEELVESQHEFGHTAAYVSLIRNACFSWAGDQYAREAVEIATISNTMSLSNRRFVFLPTAVQQFVNYLRASSAGPSSSCAAPPLLSSAQHMSPLVASAVLHSGSISPASIGLTASPITNAAATTSTSSTSTMDLTSMRSLVNDLFELTPSVFAANSLLAPSPHFLSKCAVIETFVCYDLPLSAAALDVVFTYAFGLVAAPPTAAGGSNRWGGDGGGSVGGTSIYNSILAAATSKSNAVAAGAASFSVSPPLVAGHVGYLSSSASRPDAILPHRQWDLLLSDLRYFGLMTLSSVGGGASGSLEPPLLEGSSLADPYSNYHHQRPSVSYGSDEDYTHMRRTLEGYGRKFALFSPKEGLTAKEFAMAIAYIAINHFGPILLHNGGGESTTATPPPPSSERCTAFVGTRQWSSTSGGSQEHKIAASSDNDTNYNGNGNGALRRKSSAFMSRIHPTNSNIKDKEPYSSLSTAPTQFRVPPPSQLALYVLLQTRVLPRLGQSTPLSYIPTIDVRLQLRALKNTTPSTAFGSASFLQSPNNNPNRLPKAPSSLTTTNANANAPLLLPSMFVAAPPSALSLQNWGWASLGLGAALPTAPLSVSELHAIFDAFRFDLYKSAWQRSCTEAIALIVAFAKSNGASLAAAATASSHAQSQSGGSATNAPSGNSSRKPLLSSSSATLKPTNSNVTGANMLSSSGGSSPSSQYDLGKVRQGSVATHSPSSSPPPSSALFGFSGYVISVDSPSSAGGAHAASSGLPLQFYNASNTFSAFIDDALSPFALWVHQTKQSITAKEKEERKKAAAIAAAAGEGEGAGGGAASALPTEQQASGTSGTNKGGTPTQSGSGGGGGMSGTERKKDGKGALASPSSSSLSPMNAVLGPISAAMGLLITTETTFGRNEDWIYGVLSSSSKGAGGNVVGGSTKVSVTLPSDAMLAKEKQKGGGGGATDGVAGSGRKGGGDSSPSTTPTRKLTMPPSSSATTSSATRSAMSMSATVTATLDGPFSGEGGFLPPSGVLSTSPPNYYSGVGHAVAAFLALVKRTAGQLESVLQHSAASSSGGGQQQSHYAHRASSTSSSSMVRRTQSGASGGGSAASMSLMAPTQHSSSSPSFMGGHAPPIHQFQHILATLMRADIIKGIVVSVVASIVSRDVPLPPEIRGPAGTRGGQATSASSRQDGDRSPSMISPHAAATTDEQAEHEEALFRLRQDACQFEAFSDMCMMLAMALWPPPLYTDAVRFRLFLHAFCSG